MKSFDEILQIARAAITIEYQTIEALIQDIDDDFAKAVEAIYLSKGRVIVSGIGKSAIIANKLVATLNSTGTPAIFMHAADAIHGDLGNIQQDDVVIVLSKSGNTPEIKVLLPLIKSFGNKIISIVANRDSYLAQQSDWVLHTTVEREACPNNLAPTSSTTAQMVMGDALAICLLECRNFSSSDFARYHPGGALGKRLYMRVADLYTANAKPMVQITDRLQDVIMVISSNRLGATAVINEAGELAGIVTDGDLRRMLEMKKDFTHLTALDIMTVNPITVLPDMLAVEAFELMKKRKITQLIVAENNIYFGVIHMHDILREGIV